MPAGLQLSAVKFNNEPFVRTLTASIVDELARPLEGGTDYVQWTYDDDPSIWATLPSGSAYTNGQIASAGIIGTLHFYVSGYTYDVASQIYAILQQTILGSYLTAVNSTPLSTVSYTLSYDTFPDIPNPILFVNFENTEHSSLFYRETSNTPYTFTLSAKIDEELLSKANLLSASNNFANRTAWTRLSVDVIPKVFPGPDNGIDTVPLTYTADVIVPLTGIPYNTVSSIDNFQNDTVLRPPGIYTVDMWDYETNSTGVSAIFEIGISLLSTVSSIQTIQGGYGYSVNDIITIDNSVFPGIDVDTPQLSFNITSVKNTVHEIVQTVNLSAGYNTFSIYVYPSGTESQYIYFKTQNENYGNIIFDLFGLRAHNTGLWENDRVTIVNPASFNLSGFFLQDNAWTRCAATLRLSANERIDFSIGTTTNFTNISSDANNDSSILFWGAQIEPRSSSTSYNDGLYYKSYNKAWLQLNQNSTIQTPLPLSSTEFATLCSFNIATSCISSVQVYISANTSINSLTSWYTPHIFTASISGRFVPSFLSANFIGYTNLYFDNSGSQVINNSSNYTASPGLCFYGEGHTEKIILSATNYPNARYTWSFDDPETLVYEVTSIDSNTNTTNFLITSTNKDLSAYVPSRIGYYPKIPISLFVTDNIILSSGPRFRKNDTTGILEPYPFYYSTSLNLSNGVTVSAYENPLNNLFRKNIDVQSYTPVPSSFTTDLSGNLFLPVDLTQEPFFGQFLVALQRAGAGSIDPCYDKYNIVWKWSTLSGCAVNPSSLYNKPSSWATVQRFLSAGSLTLTADPGPFPKKWRKERYSLSGAQTQPEFYTGSNLFWTVSAPNWIVNTTTPDTETTYNFALQYNQSGRSIFTTSIYEDTPVTLIGKQTVTAVICAEPFDWGFKSIDIIATNPNTVVLSRGDFRFYTQNRYVLTAVPIKFENLSVGFNRLSSLTVDFDNSTSITLTGDEVYNNFTTSYTEPGRKTITATIRYNTGEVLIERFRNIINIVSWYDEVDPVNYRTPKTALQLPWPNIPTVASNDWITEDNINSVIKKFYENLQYLENRGRAYYDTPVEFYGWLGPQPIIPEEVCPIYTWEETECLVPSNSADIFWTVFECVSSTTLVPEITADGRLAGCGTWEQQYCDPASQNPDCFGKYCTEWKWKYRKSSNTTKTITWRQTRAVGPYPKRWIFEPCVTQNEDTIIGLNCDEGYWNVNIPKINNFYDPITLCSNFKPCTYKSILAYKDLIFVTNSTEIKVLSSGYDPFFITTKRTIDDLFAFRNIKNICIDSAGKIYVLDGTLNKIASYFFDINSPIPWEPFLSWGGFGTADSNYKFSQPNDLHVDALDNVWIADTGNKCVKHYTNSGTWIQTITDQSFEAEAPLSVVVDSSNLVHILLKNKIRVYSYQGKFAFEYTINEHENLPILRLSTNYNREIIYTVSPTQVGKYFRNGAFAGFVVDNKKCFIDINGACQDEYRNVLVISGNKIGKFVDPMRIRLLKGPLPKEYWLLNDLLTHKEEYIQDWVYNKSFQRLWDNIEIFRHSLVFETDEECSKYVPPVYEKDKIYIGQNEIVTSTVVNRVITYLWDNLQTLIKYFDPACIFAVEEEEVEKQRSLEEITLVSTTTQT